MKSKTFLLLVISTCFLNASGLGQTVSIIGTPSPSTGGSASYPGYYGRDTSLYPPTTITDSNGATYGLWFSASSSVLVGQTVYLFATPSLGYSFTQWTRDANSTQNPLGITATTDLNVTAIFTPDPISLAIPVSPTSGGVVYQPYYASDPGGGTSYSFADSSGQAYSLWYPTSQSVVPGTTVYLYAVPATGYSFSEWTGDANGTENPVPVTAGSDLNVSASFQLLSYNLTAQVTGDGNVSGTGTYTYGAQTTLSATPGTGSSFLGWDSYDSSSGTWAAGSGAGSLDESTVKSATVYQDTYFNSYFSPDVYPTDSNLTDSLKTYLASYAYPLYFSGVPIGKNPSQLTQAHLESLFSFDSSSAKKITDLEGLQYAKNLTSLVLQKNGIQDLAPLWSLSKLSYLDLSEGGSISSVEGFSNLPVLTYLYLDKHRISSITPLIDLPYLYHLKIKANFLDLSDLDLQTEIYNLRSRGVTVEVERQVPKPIQDLTTGMETQKAQLLLSSNDAQANFVFALELLLNLLEDNGSRSLKSLALSLGASDAIRSFALPDLWLEDLNYGEETNASFEYSEVETYLDKTLLKTLEIADLHLAKITDENTYITLTQDLTGLEQVIYADIGDVHLLRAMIQGLSGLTQIVLSHEWPMTAGTAQAMHDSGIVSLESLFDYSERFGKLKNPNRLPEARKNLENAISLYQSASVYLLYRIAEQRFFNLSTDDLVAEERFRQDLNHALASFDYQYDMNSSNDSKTDAFHLHKFFSSKVDLGEILPPAVGNKFESSEATDPTFGGLLPYWTSETLKEKMQKADLLANDSIEGAKEVPGSSNWNQSNWLGYFYLPARTDTGNFWMYHAYLGWVYLSSSSPSDIWLFQETTNAWLWTKKSTFPFLYDNTAKAWLYLTSSGELMKWDGTQWDE
jgi:Leucine-rich repeat (LRR) protein